MRQLLLSLIITLSTLSANAIEIKVSQDTAKQKKYSLRFVGRVDAYAYSDSYKSVERHNGIQYLMPERPSYDPISGADLNFGNQLRYSIATTRLGFGGAIQFNEKNSVEAYIEADFMANSTTSPSLVPRLRHAYAKLNLGNSSILFGQTSHLALYEEIAPNTVSFGAGYPFNVLSRPIQFRFTQTFADKFVSLSIAASMFNGNTQMQMQSRAMTPDISIRATVGDPNKNSIAVMAGFKSIMPEMDIVSDKSERMNAFYGGIMGRVTIGKGFAIRAFGLVGGDLSTLSMAGGFAPLLDLEGYAPVSTLSTWLDFATPRYAGFEFGVFAGYQQNLGSTTDILSTEIVTANSLLGIANYWRVSPRMWYHYKMLSFGLEYMYTEAIWMHTWDNRYIDNLSLPTASNNRITVLCRFTF